MKVEGLISIIIIIGIILGIIGIFYIILNPNEGDNYTEFYLLGTKGKASDYPTNLNVNQIGNLIVGVANHENLNSNYLLKITENNKTLKNEKITLKNNEQIEIPFNFSENSPGQYKIQFDLYKLPDTKNVYRSLFILVNVN
ncbi:DUF1616 domain-containing protein [Methanobacterium formicicum]|uniref:Putative membrane protein n=1 Tax=Methanobacterium formicicum TaxID=2162 RepID=A0A090IA80_METFO|nr:DUF1616 domain-containing protein [Methanobacterium formicicum]MDH2659456.1 DUF1616 domain-containing protein [Methanobacterium formicicum]CEA14322.1 putative membrane protein [Methanobacterium formicicum]